VVRKEAVGERYPAIQGKGKGYAPVARFGEQEWNGAPSRVERKGDREKKKRDLTPVAKEKKSHPPGHGGRRSGKEIAGTTKIQRRKSLSVERKGNKRSGLIRKCGFRLFPTPPAK